ncbi:hypothetical protein AB0C15_01785 [Micromonospora sp. NPDC048835]|uniref:hypothetical protein n=1 Tax=Micromonospora sp. NPDC048835 TaxID=3155147 RepID=UPI0033DCE284
MDVSAETVALVTLGNDLQMIVDGRIRAGQHLSRYEIEAIEFVRDRLARLEPKTPEQPAVAGPAAASTTPSPAEREGNVHWHDEFLDLLVRAARKVKVWIRELEDGPDQPDRASTAVPGIPRPLDPGEVRGLGGIDPRSDLYRRSSTRLGELLDQSPALRALWSNGQLNTVSRHRPPQVIRRANMREAAAAALESLRADPTSALNRAERRNPPHLPPHLRTRAVPRPATL